MHKYRASVLNIGNESQLQDLIPSGTFFIKLQKSKVNIGSGENR